LLISQRWSAVDTSVASCIAAHCRRHPVHPILEIAFRASSFRFTSARKRPVLRDKDSAPNGPLACLDPASARYPLWLTPIFRCGGSLIGPAEAPFEIFM